MSPPPYSDLGKRAKDVFGKGYHFGLIKLDCNARALFAVWSHRSAAGSILATSDLAS
jgi:hypothetical protein